VAHETPTLKTVTLTNANTNYQLSALLAAIDPDIIGIVGKGRCQYLQLQFDINAGADLLFIGNADISGTNFGVCLVGTQAWPMHSMENNLIRTDQIYLRSNGAGHVVYVAMLTR
jgi:hypothetical protein